MHETLVHMVREKPQALIGLLRDLDVMPWPARTIRETNPELSQLVPPALRCDLVLELGRRGERAGVILEVQLRRDPDKPWVWPVYFHQVRAQLRADALLVVITRSQSVAQWASTGLRSAQPDTSFRPIVLGPDTMERITDPKTARRYPDLALLSALIHAGRKNDADVVRAATKAISTLPRSRGILYTQALARYASKGARPLLDRLMLTFKDSEIDLPALRALVDRHKAKGIAEGKAKGIAEGKAKGIAEGKAKGKAKGLAEGKANGMARSLMRVLAARGMTLRANQRARVLACRDLAQLDAWLKAAATASSVNAVFKR